MPTERPAIATHEMLFSTLALTGKRVVDIGCGDGRLASRIADAGAARVTGVECSPRQLAKAACQPRRETLDIVEGVAQSLPLPDASMDVAIYFNSLHHVPADVIEAAMADTARVLVTGGLVYVNEPIAEGPFFTLCKAVDDETRVRQLAWNTLHTAHKHDLEIIEEREFTHTVHMADFEAFADRLVSANTEREARMAAHEADLRDLFMHLGTPHPDSATRRSFAQPCRMTLLRRV